MFDPSKSSFLRRLVASRFFLVDFEEGEDEGDMIDFSFFDFLAELLTPLPTRFSLATGTVDFD